MYYRQPRYFTDFNCTGGDCPDNCCHGWRIDWEAEEVEKLKSAPNISQELKEIIDRSFVPNVDYKGKYQIKFNEDGNCPCLTEDRFCRIQRELGAEYLSDVCMIYPRHYIFSNNLIYRYCNMSCYELMRKLLNDEKSMDLVNVPIKELGILKGVLKDTSENLKAHPELKYRCELLEFFYEVIADKKRSVEDSIILGALAAQKLSQYAEDGNYDLIPDALTAFKKQFHNPDQLKKIAAIKPNYNIKLGLLAEGLKAILNGKSAVLTGLTDKTGKLNIDLYLQGEQRLDETYKDRPFYLRNIALNLLLELALPFKFVEKTIFENYSIFVTAVSLFKLNTIAASELTKRSELNRRVSDRGVNLNVNIEIDTDKYVHKACAIISRSLCHSNDNVNKLLALLQEKGMNSPAYLALLVK